jgi:hypothetical protein
MLKKGSPEPNLNLRNLDSMSSRDGVIPATSLEDE